MIKVILQVILIGAIHFYPTTALLYWVYLGCTMLWVLHHSYWLEHLELSPVCKQQLRKRVNPLHAPSKYALDSAMQVARRCYYIECFFDVAICAVVLINLPIVANFIGGLL